MTPPAGDRAHPARPVSLQLPGEERRRRRFTRTQALIWASQRLHPDVPLANMGKRSRIDGPLDPARLVEAFDAVARRTEMLRSVVASDTAGQPCLRVLDVPPRATEVIDLPAGDLDRWCDERIAQPVDATSCVYDSVLLRHDDHDWTWWLDLHHVATDAWSSALVFEATSAAYDALTAVVPAATGGGSDVVLESTSTATSDSAAASTSHSTSESTWVGGSDDNVEALLDEAVGAVVDPTFLDGADMGATAARGATRDTPDDRASAWTAVVDAAAPHTPLAPYGPRGRRTTRVDRVRFGVDGRLDELLGSTYRSISRELGLLTLSAMATAIALHRLDGRRTVLAGVPVHHRSSRHTRKLVGPVMELYPLAVAVDPDEPFSEMFRRTLRSITQLLQRAKPGESPDAPFEVVLNVLTARYGDFAGLPTTTEWMRSGHVDPNHVLRSQIFDYAPDPGSRPAGDGFHWELDANRGLGADPQRLAAHVAAVVAALIDDPGGNAGAVALVGTAERSELALVEPSPEPRPLGLPVHEQIRRLLADRPDTVVAEHGHDSLTAAAFDRRADEVCDALLARGLTPGRAVGLRMPRSLDVLVAIHGVLRAGGVFVMLSPDDPAARHEAIAADADLFDILEGLPDPVDRPGDVRRPAVGLDDLAYVLYTSGSTGRPKGVPIPHRGLADYMSFAVEQYVEPGTSPVVALHSSLVFDLTVTSLFLSFLCDGRVVVFDADPVTALGEVAADDHVTFLKATPSQLEIYARLAPPDRPLRTVVVGGEAFRRPVARRMAAVCAPGVRIFNEYGPTEAVVGCMIHEWDPEVDTGSDVPIGHAAPGTRLVVLDGYGHLTPSGAWGELYVRRPGMAAGYLHLPEATAERFVALRAEVTGSPDGTAWYRTGDRVRVERPGVLVYGGRMDDQLKVGGIRLEPAEVEAAIVALDGIDSALVRVWHPAEHRAGDQRCRRCGLGIDVPGTTLDHDGVCNVCRTYDAVAPQAEQWFRTVDDLDTELGEARRRRRGGIDCLHLLSGGKDSTYALYQLVEQGWNVHAFTLDNGFISDGAKENIRRSVADLGITHEFATTPAMNEIFRDSLDRHANVCQGCYKTIYTLAVARAHEMGIPVIVTGLSRGQFFETRLVPHQFEAGRFDADEIDRTVLEARKVYHHTPDAVTQLLPEQRVFDDDAIFDEVRFVDFYRYVDVDLAELYDFLEHRAPWVRPADTGRSTNCLVNVAGIKVHTTERGYHNYAEPYSWDVRLGHKTREEALEELDDEIDDAEVADLLAAVGYEPKSTGVLTAWYRADHDLDPADLRAALRAVLPEHAIPSAFVRIDEVPLAASAKADPSLLPAPTRFHRSDADRIEPATATEARVADIWAAVLGLDAVGVTDDFFDLGGASLAALETVAAVDVALGTDLPDAAVFRHRTVRELAAAVDRALIDAPASGTGGLAAIPPLDPDAVRPVSAGEEALLFDYRLDPSSARHSVIRRYVVDGSLDPDRFGDAVRTVAMAHTPLHTSYASDRHVLGPGEAVDVAVLPPMSRDDFDRFADVQRTVPFDLDDGPLVRVHLAAVDHGARTAVLLALHHISVDAATFDLLWEQVVAAHEHGSAPDLPVSAAQHAAWQRSSDTSAGREFWLDRARSRPETGRLRLAPPATTEPDGYLSVVTSIDASSLATDGTTKFSAAMAAAALTLASYTARADVEFGITFSTKDHPDTADLVGYYLNTVPMALDVSADRSVRHLLHDAADLVAAAIEHRTYPFASIVRDARAEGLPAPNVSAMLAYEQLAPAVFAGGVVEQRFLPSGVSVTDVTFFVHERPDHVELGLEYRGSVLSRADAERLLRDFGRALHTVASGPSTTVRAVAEMLGADDRSGPQLPAVERTVLADIVEHCASSPASVAVAAGHSELSRGDLVRAVEATAQRLTDAGLGRGARIGVGIGSRPDVVIAVLAAQSIGAAYVPLDPHVPLDRRRRIADAARIDALLVAPGDPGDVPGCPVVEVTAPGDLAAARDHDPSALESLRRRVEQVEPDDSAYVIFTSGSTGTPRGVEVSHRNLASSNAARTSWYGHTPERFLLTSSIGFDSSVVGLFWPLATGGTIVLPSADEIVDVDRLGDLIARHGVTHLLMVPSKYAALLDRAGAQLTGLQVAIVAGEACPPVVVDAHHRLLPGVELVNEYGPTEATVWATAHRLPGGDGGVPAVVPIGDPIPGTTARIVDDRLLPTPVGVAGELLLAGPGITSGYLGDRSATAARFVDDPSTSVRWYRTGDLARSSGGPIEFVGRLDDQLNVGGVRLEPGEVEDELRRLPGVRDAVVVAAGTPARLVAHLHMADDGVRLDETALSDELLRRLPSAMVPRRFVAHADLPRNVHGKVDRQAVAALAVEPRVVDHVEARTSDLERVAVDAWRAVLDRPGADADTDFFTTGGDSLAAVEIVNRVADRIGRPVTVAALLSGRTPRGLAALLDTADDRSVRSGPSATPSSVRVVRLREGRQGGPVVVMCAAWDDVFGYRSLARALPEHLAVVAVAHVEEPGAPVVTTVDGLVREAEPLVRAALGDPAAPAISVLGWSVGGVVAAELADRLRRQGLPVVSAVLVDTYFPGQQHHLWSNRWWKYKSLMRPGAFGQALSEMRIMGGRRLRTMAARAGRRLLQWSGADLQLEPERRTVGGFPAEAFEHPLQHVATPVWLYHATTTNPARNVVPWGAVADDLTVIDVDGRHRGFDSIMEPPRVSQIADDLARRLSS